MHPLSTKNISPPLKTLCPLLPQRTAVFGTVSQSGKSAPCSVRSAHIITQQHSHSPWTSTPKKKKSASKFDYSCVSSGWEIWPVAYWHLTSDLSSLPLSCKWSSAAGSNCMTTISFIKSYARYFIYLYINMFCQCVHSVAILSCLSLIALLRYYKTLT